jgi:hypothetical protein
VLGDLGRARPVGLGGRWRRARKPSTIRLYIENARAMSTASWTSPSVAPAALAVATSSAGQGERSRRTVREMCSSACIFGRGRRTSRA